MKGKLAAIFATVIVALVIVGFAYGAWSETLTIEGNVTTGQLNVGIRRDNIDCSCSDEMTCSWEGFDDDADDYYERIKVTVSNGYPGGQCSVTFEVHNLGTIPAKIKDISITGNTVQVATTLTGLSVGEIIDVGGSKSCTLTLTVTSSANEVSTYSVIVTIDAVQFNAP